MGLSACLRIPLKAIPKSTIVPVLSGPNRGLKWNVGSGNHGCWIGIYESYCTKKLEQHLGFPNIAFDVGAHVGYYTLMMARRARKVFAFEANPRNAIALSKHVKINNLQNVQVIDAAVSSSEGTTWFDGDGYIGRISDHGSDQVRTTRLDDYETPDFIKMDIEGAEVEALNGAARIISERRTAWYIATHGGTRLADAQRLLAGYRFDHMGPDEFFAFPA